jgi:hypothetical protein
MVAGERRDLLLSIGVYMKCSRIASQILSSANELAQ